MGAEPSAGAILRAAAQADHSTPILEANRDGPSKIASSTTSENARRLGVSRERVRQMLDLGTLAGCRIEGHPRARYVDISGEGAENDQVLLSIQDAARRADVSASTVRAWI